MDYDYDKAKEHLRKAMCYVAKELVPDGEESAMETTACLCEDVIDELCPEHYESDVEFSPDKDLLEDINEEDK